MSDTTTAPSEQPGHETAPIETPGAQPDLDPTAAFDSLSQEQMRDLLFSDRPAATEPAPTQTPPAAETPPAEETPPANPAESDGEQPTEPGKQDLRRIPMGGIPMSERQQLAEVARMIRAGEATTTMEALAKLGALPTTPAAQAPPIDPETPPAQSEADPVTTAPAPSSDRVAQLEASIAELRAKRDQAEEDYDVVEKRRLTAEIEDTVGLLAQARIEAREQQAEAVSYQDRYVQAVDVMEAKYDWAADPDSARYQALDDKVTAAMARNDPRLQDPNYIIAFADEIEGLFGNTPAPAKTTTPPPPPPSPAPKIIGGGVAPGHGHAKNLTEAEVLAIAENMTQEQLSAVLFRS